MRRIFDIHNPIMRFAVKLFDCMCLSVLWLVACLPVITIGASTTAMFAVIHRYIRLDEGRFLITFWKTFREEFKRTTACWLVGLVLFGVLVVDALVFRTMAVNGQLLGMLYWVILAFVAVEATWLAYAFAYAERFTGGVVDTLRVSLFMILMHPIKSATVMVIVLAAVALTILAPGFLTIVPAICCWLCDIVLASVFVQHLREEDRERLENSRGESAEEF